METKFNKCIKRKSKINPLGVAELRQIARDSGLPTSGNKKELCNRIFGAKKRNLRVTPIISSMPKVTKVAEAVKTTKAARPKLTLSKGKAFSLRNKAKVVGQGSTGCVHRPPLKCKDSDDIHTGISKLMTKSAANKERKTYDDLKFNIIDPNGYYHIRKPEICEAPDEADEECTKKGGDTLLLYEDGGHDLAKILNDGEHTLSQVISGLSNIFMGVAIMNKGLSYHHDIKIPNIVTSDDKYRLIDFGLSKNYSPDHYEDSVNDSAHFSNVYYPWPCEMIFLYNLFPVNDHNIAYHTNEYAMDEFNQYMFPLDNLNTMELGIIMRRLAGMDPVERHRLILEKSDVFSLGTVLLNVLSYFKGDERYDEIMDFAKVLIDIDPVKRPTPRDAYLRFKLLS